MSLPNHLQPKVEQSGNVRIITFTGNKIREVENVLASELEGHTEHLGECHLLLDFTHVEYITSVELGTLISIHKQTKASGGRLTLFNLSAQVYEVFTLTRLDMLMRICRESALSSPNRDFASCEDRWCDDGGQG